MKTQGLRPQPLRQRSRQGSRAIAAVLLLASAAASAQERFLIEGIFDAELHDTDTDSHLLSRNDGDLSYVGRVQLWSAYQVSPSFQVYALVEGEIEDASGETESEAEFEQYAVRYTRHSSPSFFIEAGRILGPLTVYSDRHLSSKNPLIGQPYTFLTTYPIGAQIGGSFGKFDYRAAMVDEPDIKPDFLSIEPGTAYRPVLGFGFSPVQQLRFGVSYTEGPYLGGEADPGLPAGASWRDYDQQVLGFDFQYARGYLELNGQFVSAQYEIPFASEDSDNESYYVELKYTFTPRFYGAVRYGKNNETAIEYLDGLNWAHQDVEFGDLELGVGYRFTASSQLKMAYRNIQLDEEVALLGGGNNGHAVSLQFSHQFDVRSWWSRLSAGSQN